MEAAKCPVCGRPLMKVTEWTIMVERTPTPSPEYSAMLKRYGLEDGALRPYFEPAHIKISPRLSLWTCPERHFVEQVDRRWEVRSRESLDTEIRNMWVKEHLEELSVKAEKLGEEQRRLRQVFERAPKPALPKLRKWMGWKQYLEEVRHMTENDFYHLPDDLREVFRKEYLDYIEYSKIGC